MLSTPLSLSELARRLAHAVRSAFPEPLWVVAEIANLQEHRNGHCYLELVEVDPSTRARVASMRATIWANRYSMLKPMFQSGAGIPLAAGLKVLFFAQPDFHPQYGLSLNITSIDPTYTAGALAQARMRTIERLRTEGLYGLNKSLPFPELPRRIAIVSAKNAAGYQDFVHHLAPTVAHFHLHLQLFEALMQGEQAPQSIVTALAAIARQSERWDLVILIRGGGSQLDLLCFDDYAVAAAIARTPIPVITGIGHQRDESVADLVAFQSVKTPTAAAEFIAEYFTQAQQRVLDYAKVILTLSTELQRNIKGELQQLALRASKAATLATRQNARRGVELQARIVAHLRGILANQRENHRLLANNVLQSARQRFMLAHTQLQGQAKLFRAVNPFEILARGYALVRGPMGVVKSAEQLQAGTPITILLSDGTKNAKIE